MNELLVVEKITASGKELVRRGYSRALLTRYLARQNYTTPNAVFVLRAARDTDMLNDVPEVNCIVQLSSQ